MGNHTKPWDIDEDGMRPSSYTLAENWGGQINFMIPLDREGLNRWRSIAARQEEKMRLDYELVRVLKCTTPPKPLFKPWSQPQQECKMSTLSDQIAAREAAAKAKKTTKKTTKSTKEES